MHQNHHSTPMHWYIDQVNHKRNHSHDIIRTVELEHIQQQHQKTSPTQNQTTNHHKCCWFCACRAENHRHRIFRAWSNQSVKFVVHHQWTNSSSELLPATMYPENQTDEEKQKPELAQTTHSPANRSLTAWWANAAGCNGGNAHVNGVRCGGTRNTWPGL